EGPNPFLIVRGSVRWRRKRVRSEGPSITLGASQRVSTLDRSGDCSARPPPRPAWAGSTFRPRVNEDPASLGRHVDCTSLVGIARRAVPHEEVWYADVRLVPARFRCGGERSRGPGSGAARPVP